MNTIKKVLKNQGRSQMWLADKIDKSYTVVTNYCNNRNQPSLHVLKSVAEVLDVDIRELLEPTKTTEDGQ